jgi:hypothetical protein
LQPQFSATNGFSNAVNGYTINLFIRRTRLLFGGSLFGVVDYFVETDFANLFQGTPVAGNAMAMPPTAATDLKATPGMNIQDAFATAKPFGDVAKLDVGYMLPPLAHNAVQSAASLYSWDYFTYSFQSSNAFGSSANPVGRDLGAQLRGLVAGGLIEYRAGLFQGLRVPATATDIAGKNFFRFTGRLQINLLDPETGFFYAGTYLGAKKILSLGGSVDIQDSYKYFAGDAFADLPLGPGVLTGQFNFAYWNGNTANGGIIPLVKQTAEMFEGGYLISALHFSPIVRVEHITGGPAVAPAPAQATQTRIGGGLGFWPFGHNTNVKLFYQHIAEDGAAQAINQINLQWQIFYY